MVTGRGFCPTPGGIRQSEDEAKRAMKKLALLAVMAVLAGCNTIAGVGEDISGTARTVQDTF